MQTLVNLGHINLDAGFRKTESGKTLVVFEGFPQPNEGLSPDRIRDLAEALYQIARLSELDSYPAISLRY